MSFAGVRSINNVITAFTDTLHKSSTTSLGGNKQPHTDARRLEPRGEAEERGELLFQCIFHAFCFTTFRPILRLKSSVWGLFLFMPEGHSAEQLVGAGSTAIVLSLFCKEVSCCVRACVCVVCVCVHQCACAWGGAEKLGTGDPPKWTPSQCWRHRRDLL